MKRTTVFPSLTSKSTMAHTRSRRAFLRATALTGGLLASGIGFPAIGAGRAAAASLPEGLAQTPLGEQIAWFLATVNGGGAGLTEAEIAAHLSPNFLAAIPPAQIVGLMQGIAGGYGALTLQGVTRVPTESQAVALVGAAAGVQLALPITVENTAPHRITGLTIYPSPSGDGTPLLPEADADPADATLVEIGGRRLYCAGAGTGGPTVVLEAGLGDSAATWTGIIPAIAGFARVVGYDRANTTAGASDPAPMPRTAADAVADLHNLLTAAAIPGPYVLVGHSIGGLFVRLYASSYPEEVAGLVLVDASHEEQDARREAMVSPELFAPNSRRPPQTAKVSISPPASHRCASPATRAPCARSRSSWSAPARRTPRSFPRAGR